MNATSRWLGGLLLAAVAASPALAQPPGPCCIPRAPDMCGQGYYLTDACGCVYGPYYCVRPCFPPFNGMLPGAPPRPGQPLPPGVIPSAPPLPPSFAFPGAPGVPAVPLFPSHPYARGPRDFFMYE
jgi:Ca-activated chloride channel family protein